MQILKKYRIAPTFFENLAVIQALDDHADRAFYRISWRACVQLRSANDGIIRPVNKKGDQIILQIIVFLTGQVTNYVTKIHKWINRRPLSLVSRTLTRQAPITAIKVDHGRSFRKGLIEKMESVSLKRAS